MKNLRNIFLVLGLACSGIASFAQVNPPPNQKTSKGKYSPAILTSLFDGTTLNGWTAVPADGWTVTDSAIAMTGNARGVVYTHTKYSSYRVIFSVRQVKGVDHWPCQLIFGPDAKLDALGALQFQLPKGWTWDYRPGKNNSGKDYFSFPGPVPNVNKTDWARCEILVDAATGSARTAVAQPVGSPAVPATVFKDAAIPDIPTAFGIQSHNKGQFDEYKDILVEADPKVKELLTVLPAPSNLRVTRKTNTKIALTWTDNANVEDGFTVQRSTDHTHWTIIARLGMNSTGYTDRTIRKGALYEYRVAAFNAAAITLSAVGQEQF